MRVREVLRVSMRRNKREGIYDGVVRRKGYMCRILQERQACQGVAVYLALVGSNLGYTFRSAKSEYGHSLVMIIRVSCEAIL